MFLRDKHSFSLASTLTLALVAFAGCSDDEPADSMGSETGSETVDPTVTGDGDGDDTMPTEGDGDGDDTATTEGDGDGDEPTCDEPGCPCTSDANCGDGLACIDNTCQETICGDNVVQGDEECEDGNLTDGDGCDNDCTFTRVNRVAAGEHHSCALIDGGAIVCWGRGEFGQLGYGNANNVGDDEFPSDVGPVPLPAGVRQLELGSQHTCAVFDDTELRCWGLNDRGQLGYGNLANFGDDEPLAALPAISVPTAIEVQAMSRSTCARVGNGEVRCWGANTSAELGYGNITPELLSPGGAVSLGSAAAGLSSGFQHSCASLIDGGLRCWGRNDVGQLGLGNVNPVGDNEVPSSVGLVQVVPPALPANTEVLQVSLGGNHGCALLGTGDIICWGANGSGQLGYGDINNTGDDETPATRIPVDIGGPAVEVTCGANHSCARRQDGQVFCWGDNTVGQLGYGNLDNIGDDETPALVGAVQIGGTVVQMSAGGNHTCVLTDTADVRCWGQNNFSQLGLGVSVTIGDNETPSQVDPVSIL